MKKMAIFLCLMGMAVIGMAQAPAHLKGPAAKNYKPWKDRTAQPDNMTLVTVEKAELTGPAAKNRPTHQRQEGQYLQVVSLGKSTPQLMGPQYKNRNALLQSQSSEEDVAQDKATPAPNKRSESVGGGQR